MASSELSKVFGSDAQKYAQSIGIVYSLQPKLLTKQKIEELQSMRSATDVLKALDETTYRSLVGFENIGDYEKEMHRVLRAHFKELIDVAPEKWVLELFQLKHDFYNIKLFVKERLAAFEEEKEAELLQEKPSLDHVVFSPLGCVPQQKFEEQLATPKEKLDFGEEYEKRIPVKNLVLGAFAAFQEKRDAKTIDLFLDKKYFEEVFKRAGEKKFFKNYFSTAVDLFNLQLLLKAKKIFKNIVAFSQGFLAGGKLEFKELHELFSEDDQRFLSFVAGKPYGEAFRLGAVDFQKTGSFSFLEKLCDDFLLHFAVEESRTEAFSAEPLFVYFLLKETEAKIVLTILKTKELALPEEMVNKIVREVRS